MRLYPTQLAGLHWLIYSWENKLNNKETKYPIFNEGIRKICLYFFIRSFWENAKRDCYVHHVCPLGTTELPLVGFS